MNIKRLIYNKHYINNYPLNERTIFDFCKSEGMEYIIRNEFHEIRDLRKFLSFKVSKVKCEGELYCELNRCYSIIEEYEKIIIFYKKTVNDINSMQKNIYDVINDYNIYKNDAIKKIGYKEEPKHKQSNLFLKDTNDMLHTYRYNLFISIIVGLFNEYRK